MTWGTLKKYRFPASPWLRHWATSCTVEKLPKVFWCTNGTRNKSQARLLCLFRGVTLFLAPASSLCETEDVNVPISQMWEKTKRGDECRILKCRRSKWRRILMTMDFLRKLLSPSKITSVQSLPLSENHLPRARGLHPGWQPAQRLRGHEEVAGGESRAWACNVVSLKAHILPSLCPFLLIKRISQ